MSHEDNILLPEGVLTFPYFLFERYSIFGDVPYRWTIFRLSVRLVASPFQLTSFLFVAVSVSLQPTNTKKTGKFYTTGVRITFRGVH